MRGLSRRIMEHAETLPEAAPLCPAALLHLGNRAAVDQALSRVARSGHLMRICRGVYMRPVETRFGVRAPRITKAIAALSQIWGETIVPCGAAAANRLRLTTQNPIRVVYLTSGPSRRLDFGSSVVELRHAPHWQLAAPYRKAGDVIRGPRMAWSRGDRGLPSRGPKDTLRSGQGRACGRAGDHADLDGGTGERAHCAWMSRGSGTSRPMTGATLSGWRSWVGGAKRQPQGVSSWEGYPAHEAPARRPPPAAPLSVRSKKERRPEVPKVSSRGRGHGSRSWLGRQ